MKTKKIKWTLIAFLAAIFVSTFIGGTAITANTSKVYASSNSVASLNGTEYDTITDALANVSAGDNTVTLLADTNENITVTQVEGVNIVIDGAGYEYSGTITIHGGARYEGAETLTIKNVNFVTSVKSHYSIDSNSTASAERYAHNVTIDNCTFTATGEAVKTAAAIRLRQAFNVNVTKTTATGMHSLLQGYGISTVAIDNVTIKDGKNGIALGTSLNATVSNSTIDVDGYGIRADASETTTLTIDTCNVNAFIPVVLRKASTDYSVVIDGTNTMTATNSDNVWFASGTEEYVESGKLPTGVKVGLTVNDANLNNKGIYNFPVAEVSSNGVVVGSYYNIKEAIDAAQTGDVVTIYANTSANNLIAYAFNKSITIKGAEINDNFYVEVPNMIEFQGTDLEVTFENIHFWYGPNDAATTDQQIREKGIKGIKDLTYINCSFNYQVNLYGDNVTFVDCDFIQESRAWYNVCMHEVKEVLFDGCTFISRGGAVHMHNDGSHPSDVTLNQPNFISYEPKAGVSAIEIVSRDMSKGNIVKINFTTNDPKYDPPVLGFMPGDETGGNTEYDTLWDIDDFYGNNKIKVIINGITYLEPAVAMIGNVRYTKLADAIKDAQGIYAGQTIVLIDDCEVNEDVVIDKNVTIVNDTGATAYPYGITVTDAGSFTVNANFTLTGINGIFNYGDITVTNNATLTIDGIANYGKLTVDGASFVADEVVNYNEVNINNSNVVAKTVRNNNVVNIKNSTVSAESYYNNKDGNGTYLDGSVTIIVNNCTGGKGFIAKDKAVLNNSVLTNGYLYTKGSLTVNGGLNLACLWTLSDAEGGKGGTITIEDDTTITATLGVYFLNEYTVNGGKINIIEGTDGDVKGVVFQDAENVTINGTDISVNGTEAIVHLYNVEVIVNDASIKQVSDSSRINIYGNSNLTINNGTIESSVGITLDRGTVINANNSAIITNTINNNGTITVANATVNAVAINNNGTITTDKATVVANTLVNNGTVNFKDSTIDVAVLDNDAPAYIEGKMVVTIDEATGSDYAIRAKDGTTLTNSYIKASDNTTLRMLGSLTVYGGLEVSYLEGAHSSKENAVGGTFTIADNSTVNVTYGVEFSNNYVLNGGKIVLSGTNLWGFVFQHGTYEINTDIEVVDAVMHFTQVNATINSTITRTAATDYVWMTDSIVTVNGGSIETNAAIRVRTNVTTTATLNVGTASRAATTSTIKAATVLNETGSIINLIGNVTVDATFTGTGWVYAKSANFDANTKMIGAKVRFASGINNIDGATITGGYFQVGIGAYKGTDANVDTVNGVTVNVYNNATIGATGDTYAGWVGTGFYDTDAEKEAAMTDAMYVLNVEDSIAEFGYLHVSNDGELIVEGNATTKAWYNGSDYTFYAGDFIINGGVVFDNADALVIYTKVSCDNGAKHGFAGLLGIINGATYEAERHNGATAGLNFDVRKAGSVVVQNATLEIGDDAKVAENAGVYVVDSTVVVKGSLTNNGRVILFNEVKANIANATGNRIETGSSGVTLIDSTINGSVRVHGDLTAKGALTVGNLWVGTDPDNLVTATIAGDQINAYYVMFQHGTYTISADMVLEYAYLSYGADITVTSDITTGGTTGILTYINGNVTLENGASITAKNGLCYNYDDAVLTIKDGASVVTKAVYSNENHTGDVNVYGDLTVEGTYANAGTITVYVTGTLTAKDITGNRKVVVDVSNYKDSYNKTKIIDLNATTLEGSVEIINNASQVALVYGTDGDVTLANGVARIGDIYYATLAKAISVVKNGETIYLCDTIDEVVTIKQVAGLSFTIDGQYNTYTGEIRIDGNGRDTSPEGLTIKNINFVADTKDQHFIESSEWRDLNEAHNVLIENCTFTNDGGYTGVHAVRLTRPYNVTIDKCTASDMMYLVQNTSGGHNLTIKNSTVENCDYLARVHSNYNAVIDNVTVVNSKANAIIIDAGNDTTLTVKNSNINQVANYASIYINAFATDYTIILENNVFTNTVGIWLEDKNTIVNDSVNTLKVVMGAGNTINGVQMDETNSAITFEAKIGNVYYSRIETAFAEAVKGDIIDILADVTLTKTIEIADADVLKALTINGNGHTVTLNTPGAAGFRFGAVGTARSENVTINNLTITGNAKYGIWVSDGGSTTLNNVTINGTYEYAYGGLILYGTQGATITNSSIISMFTNGGDDIKVNVVNSNIDVLFANASQSAADKAKVFIDDASTIGELWIGGNNSTPVDTASLERVGLDKAFSESTGKNFDSKIEVETDYFVYYATVNDAIYAVEDDGIVYVLPGTIDYAIAPWANDATHASEKSLTLRGAGWDTIYTDWYDNGIEPTYIQEGIFLGYDDNHCSDNAIIIQGFIFTGKGVLVSGQKDVGVINNMFLTITEPVATNSTANANAISITGQTYGNTVGGMAIIANNYISNAAVAGINLRDAYEVVILGNRIEYVGHNGITVTQTTDYDAPVSIRGNLIDTWANYNSGEGRAIRVKAYGDVEINENAFIANNLVESIVKVTNTDSIDVSRNYWAGNVPMTEQYFEYDTATKSRNNIIFNYYAKCDYDIVGDSYTLSDLRYLPAATIQAGAFASVSGTKGTESYRENIQLELGDVYTYEELYVEIWSGNTLLGITTLKDVDDEGTELIPQLGGSLTVNSVIAGRKAGSWDTEWKTALSVYNMPTLYKVYVDGWLVDTWGDEAGENAFISDEEEGDYILLDSVEGKEVVRITETGAVELYFAVDYTNGTNGAIADAIDEAGTNDTIKIYSAGYFTLPTFANKDITIAGKDHYVIFSITDSVAITGSNVIFEMIGFDYNPCVEYKGLTGAKTITYNECEFYHQVSLYGDEVTFNNCIFDQSSAAYYNLITYQAKKVVVNKTTFKSIGRSVLVYNDKTTATGTELIVTDSAFTTQKAVAGVAAIEIDSSEIYNDDGVQVSISNVHVFGFDTTANAIGADLWNNRKGIEGVNNDITVTVEGIVVLEPIHNVEGRYDTVNGQLTYTNIQSAIDDNSDVVTVLVDLTIETAVNVYRNTEIYVNGKTLTANDQAFIIDGATAYIANGTVNANATAIVVENGAFFASSGLIVTAGKNGIDAYGDTMIFDGEYTANIAINNVMGAVAILGGEFNATNGGYAFANDSTNGAVIVGGTFNGDVISTNGVVTIREFEDVEEPKFGANVTGIDAGYEISAGYYMVDVSKWVIGGYKQEASTLAGYVYEVNYRPFEAFHMTLGSNISIYYHVYLTYNQAHATDDPTTSVNEATYMTFAINNGLYETKYQYNFEKEDKADVEHYIFQLDHINPALMGDTIIATLYIDGEAVATNEYSIRKYCDDALKTHTYTGAVKSAYETLLADLLDYGAAAQLYAGYKTDKLANAGFAVTGSTYVAPNRNEAEIKSPGTKFNVEPYAPMIMYGSANTIRCYFAVAGATGDPVVDFENEVVMINRKGIITSLGYADYTKNDKALELIKWDAKYNLYYVETPEIKATELDFVFAVGIFKDYTIESMLDGAWITYSIESAVSMFGGNDTLLESDLLAELWCYGESSKAYVKAQKNA